MSLKYDLEKQIKEKFRLFAGVRDVEKDKKLFEKVRELALYEILKFAEENSELLLSNGASDKIVSEKYNEALETIADDVSENREVRFRLEKRLDYFLNNLLYQTLNN